MASEKPLTQQEWVKTRLLPLAAALFLASSAVFGMAIAETSLTTNGIAVAILTAALLTIFYATFNICSCFIPFLQPPPTSLCVVYSIPIAIWLSLTMFELTEVHDIKLQANSYNSSYWGAGSGLSHGCSWADAGRYKDKYSYDRTCSLLKGRFSISWVVLILLAAIFFSFLFGPKRILDQEEEEEVRAQEARVKERRDAESGAAEQVIEGG